MAVHMKQLYYQVIYNFHMSICLRMEYCQKIKSCFELLLESFPKGNDKYSISIINNGRREAIMFPHMFKEELSNLLCCRSLLAWHEYSHLGKSVDYYQYRFMLMFDSRISHGQVVHRNRFPCLTRNQNGCVQSVAFIQWFSNGINYAQSDVPFDVRFK